MIIPPTAQRMGVASPVGSNWICHTFLFLAWGQGPVLSPKCSILFIIISITLYHETVDKVHDLDDFKFYHFQGNSVEMTEYPIIFMMFVQFWTTYIFIFNNQQWSSILSWRLRVKFQCISVKKWKYPYKSALINAFASHHQLYDTVKPVKLTTFIKWPHIGRTGEVLYSLHIRSPP